MTTVFRYTLARFRGQIIGWAISIFLLGLLVVSFYDVIVENQAKFTELFDAYPPEMMAFLGDISTISTPEGYLSLEYFSLMPLILGIFAVLAGSGLIASDEEKGRLDLVLAYPVSRAALFWGRMLAFCAAIIVVLVIAWLGLVVASLNSSLNLSAGKLAIPYLSLLAELLLFGTLALVLSLLVPTRRMAAMAAGMALMASFFLEGLARLTDKLDHVVKVSPLHYYQSGDAIKGIDGIWLSGLLMVAVVFAFAAWVLFGHRDIRVSGEGGWGLSAVLFWRKAEA